MPKVANRFALGIFFSITFLLLLLVMIWLTGWFDASDTTPFVCYFNKDHFDEAGIPYPSNDWTWVEYSEIAGKLTKTDDDGNPIRLGSFNWPTMW